ncbi:MAG: RNA-binding protein [Gammaproteobacteria bacterium]|nr:RNA-binding protein [Gammaproteobacteria bacterium]
MQVIICHIPSKTSLRDLILFAESGIKPFLPFLPKPKIVGYEILEITDPASQEEEFHGLVNFAGTPDAQKAIKALNGKKLFGKTVEVRPYFHRSPGDRRVKRHNSGLNRPEDMRRQDLVIRKRSKDTPQISGYKLNREHGKG